jgi:hypothetical protein
VSFLRLLCSCLAFVGQTRKDRIVLAESVRVQSVSYLVSELKSNTVASSSARFASSIAVTIARPVSLTTDFRRSSKLVCSS